MKNSSVWKRCKKLFPGSEIVRSFSFKTAAPRGQSALLAKENHMLTAAFAPRGESSAHFAEKPDCFECLSPYCGEAA